MTVELNDVYKGSQSLKCPTKESKKSNFAGRFKSLILVGFICYEPIFDSIVCSALLIHLFHPTIFPDSFF